MTQFVIFLNVYFLLYINIWHEELNMLLVRKKKFILNVHHNKLFYTKFFYSLFIFHTFIF